MRILPKHLCFCKLQGHSSRHRPTLPGPCGPSTIGVDGLNGRVRNGNGCGPITRSTGNSAPESFLQLTNRKVKRLLLDTKMRLSLTADSYGLASWITPLPHPTDQSNSLLEAFRFHKGTGTSHLEVGFTLRCFQRLSRPRSSYPAMARWGQPVRQRRVQLGPLVLESTHPQKSSAYGR